MAALLDWGFAHDDAANAVARARQIAAAQRPVQCRRRSWRRKPAAQPWRRQSTAPPIHGAGVRIRLDAAADSRYRRQPARATATPVADSHPPVAPAVLRSSRRRRKPGGNWAIQLGAYDSPAKSDALLAAARGQLPPELQGGRPQSVPLQTANGWLYRARLTGYSQGQAFAACQRLADCMPVPPAAN